MHEALDSTLHKMVILTDCFGLQCVAFYQDVGLSSATKRAVDVFFYSGQAAVQPGCKGRVNEDLAGLGSFGIGLEH